MKIFVTGIGAITSIGNTAAENLTNLKNGQTGISKSLKHNLMLGEVKMSDEEIIQKLNLPEEDYSRTTLLGLMAAKEAWGKNKSVKEIRTGLIAATSVGGLDKMEEYYVKGQNSENKSLYELQIHDNGRTAESIAKYLKISGYVGTISTACSSGANAIMLGARMMQANKLDRVVVGGSDPLAQYNIKGFSSLMIYDQEICKPFDESRKGLNLGEGAAFLILENEHSLSISGNKPLCEFAGWNNSSDAFHQTASSPDGRGAADAMIKALEKANLKTDQISYVNAHGTGTGNNDLSESMALKKVFGEKMPPFSSTKGFTGHTLAAAGAIEAVYCVQSILNQAYLPNLNFQNSIKETGLIPETSFAENKNIEFVLSNSFGFGGNCTCLIFAKI